MSSHLRVGDLERDRAAAELAEHYAVGRLSHEEYDERLDAIWTARTRADLDIVFHDLPAHPSAPPQVTKRGRQGRLLPVLLVVLLVAVVIEPLWVLLVVGALAFALTRRRRAGRQPHGIPRGYAMPTMGPCGSSRHGGQQRRSA